MSFPSPTPQEEELMKAVSEALSQQSLPRRPFWLKALDLPCFAVQALGQVAKRRWAEWRGE